MGVVDGMGWAGGWLGWVGWVWLWLDLGVGGLVGYGLGAWDELAGLGGVWCGGLGWTWVWAGGLGLGWDGLAGWLNLVGWVWGGLGWTWVWVWGAGGVGGIGLAGVGCGLVGG